MGRAGRLGHKRDEGRPRDWFKVPRVESETPGDSNLIRQSVRRRGGVEVSEFLRFPDRMMGVIVNVLVHEHAAQCKG